MKVRAIGQKSFVPSQKESNHSVTHEKRHGKPSSKKIVLSLGILGSIAVAGIMIARGQHKKMLEMLNESKAKMKSIAEEFAIKINNDINEVALNSGNKLKTESKDGQLLKATLTDVEGKIIHIKEYSKIGDESSVIIRDANGVKIADSLRDSSSGITVMAKCDPTTGKALEVKKITATNKMKPDVDIYKYGSASNESQVTEVFNKHIERDNDSANYLYNKVLNQENKNVVATRDYGTDIHQKIVYDTQNKKVLSYDENWTAPNGTKEVRHKENEGLTKSYQNRLNDILEEFGL